MNWRTDKPTADVIVVKIKYIGCYMVLMKKGQDYYSMDNDIGKAPLEVIEKWADLEEDETVTNCDQLEEEIERIVEAEEKFIKFQVRSQLIKYVARHFYKLGLNARKKE